MPLGIVEKEQRGRDEFWFIQETPDGPRRELQPSALRRSGWGALERNDLLPDLDVEFSVEQGQVRDVHRYAAVPEGVRRQLDKSDCDHPGLVLDKYVYRSYDQSFVRGALQKIIDTSPGLVDEWSSLFERWRSMLGSLQARLFRCTTTGAFTLHLARASALENAGICLHPLYGFVFLPGSGLKGMARAHAETVWLPAQADKKSAWRKIEDVFGWAPSADRRKQIRDLAHPAEPRRVNDNDAKSPEVTSSCGNIVFHDAWPESWPQLCLDIVNNHHRDYYAPPDKRQEYPPGDWEEPSMVSFLSIGAENTFVFALSPRRADVSGELLDLAREWLLGALCHMGAGAKTAAGYGYFKPVEYPLPPQPTATRVSYEETLELVTPAFFAGASQLETDCDLRPATLRGLLRWWWRSLHVGFVDVDTLRRMEAAVWGDTDIGGAVQIIIEPVAGQAAIRRCRCPFKIIGKNNRGQEILQFDRKFEKEHGITRSAQGMTQGVVYGAYGMDEMKAGDLKSRKQRWCALPGNQWKIQLIARDSIYIEKNHKGDIIRSAALPKELILKQAKIALWWFCYLGAAGSKARKGFGSFADPPKLTTFEGGLWRPHATEFRQACKLLEKPFEPIWAQSPSLHAMRTLSDSVDMKPWLTVETPWQDEWKVLDEIGAALQSFTQAAPSTGHGKHCEQKRHLGLPRKIHGPRPSDNPPPVSLEAIHGDRFASPVWFHVAKGTEGFLDLRICAFPSSETRDQGIESIKGFQESTIILQSLLRHLKDYFSGIS